MSRQKFVEKIDLTPDIYFEQKKVEESTKSITITEATGSNTYQALAVYTFPISRPDQRNLNNRIYSSALWENVIRSGKAEGAFGLMDHPESEGSVKDIWCVWRNLRFSKDRKLILCDAYLFGNWGRQVLEALQAGGRVGLSSSGWGDFLPDNTTLDPDTYEIERPADFVLTPSYEVYGVQDDLVESIKNESILENSPKDHIKENRIMENVLEKTSPTLEERNFRLNMKNMFKEAQKISNIEERIKECNSLLQYFGTDTASDLYQEIKKSIDNDNASIMQGFTEYQALKENVNRYIEQNKTLNEQIKGITAEKEALENEKASLEEQLDNACTLLDSMKEYTEKQEDMLKIAQAEKNGMVSPSEYKEALIFAEEKEEEAKKLKRQVLSLRRQLEALQEAEEDDEDEEEEDDEDEDEKEAPKKSPNKTPKKSDDDDEEDDEDEDDDDDKDEVDEKKKKESRKSKVNSEVRDYYEDLEYRNPKVVKIKEEILSKRTLLEAQKTYLKLRALVEDTDYRVYKSGKKTYVESTKKNPAPLHEGWV